MNGIPIKIRLIGLALVVLACIAIGFNTRSCVQAKAQAAAQQQAAQDHAAADQHQAKGDTDAQHAQDLNPTLKADADAVAAARAKRDRNRAALHAGSTPATLAPPADPVPSHPQPVVPPVVLAPVDADSDALVAALDKQVADLEMKISYLESADQEHQAEAQALRAEVVQLRAVIAAQPRPRVWAVTGTWGTNQTLGAGVTRDFGPMRVGVDVVRRQLAGGQTTLEALVHAGWRF